MTAAAPRVARPHRRAAAFADFPPEFFDFIYVDARYATYATRSNSTTPPLE